ncbi:MAG: HAD family hydrolase [Candidatus Tokpelaia sp.]|nr:MAG: HAD family hydrolase [Candidatus Tokpelaia sp.]KAA6205318.1 MAG: HAD family hydrolase [Candidatus Tokpelaia sp.]
MTKKPILVFDLDGTLAATAPDLLDSLNYCLEKQGVEAISSPDLSQYIGHGGRAMIEQALRQHNIAPEPALVENLLADFMAYYTANIPGQSHYFEGAVETLRQFSARGFLLAVCSNKAEILVKKLVNALNKQLKTPLPFAAVSGGDSFDWKKPDPRHIFSVINQAGGDRARAVMIGDSAPDIMAARAAKIPAIAVRFGYSNIPVEDLDADKIIDSYAELTMDLVERLMADNALQPK